ncbi:MAG: FimV/HubP family polar landmark protein [Nitrosospira sp.]
MTIHSALGQPFTAEIDLVAVKKEEKHSLMARLASQDTFRQANVDYLPLLSTFKASIENRSDGQPYVRIISSQPINEPFLNMLVELNWPAGRLLREYTVLLAPPEIDAHPPAAVPGQSNRSDAPDSVHSTKAESATVEKSGLPNRGSVSGEKLRVPEPTSASQAHTVYGPVKQGDTLARIVQNIIPSSGVTVNQMLIALHRANPDAFLGNNIHRLKAGAILRIPGGREIDTIGPAEADMEVKVQTADWNRYKLADVVGLAPATERLRQTVTGKIDSSAEADVVATQESPNEILKLSNGGEAWGIDKNVAGKEIDGRNEGGKDGGETKVNDVQDRFRAMEEDAVAKSKAISEANERVVLLEKNIRELQRLLELKNLTLADMQKRVEAVDANGSTLPDPPVAISSQSGHTPGPVSGAEGGPPIAAGNVEEATPPKTVKSATEIAKPLQAAEKPGKGAVSAPHRLVESSLIDDMTANIEYLGGALALLITGVVGVSMAGRQKEALPDNSNANTVSSDLQLHDKAMNAATSVAMAAPIPAATTNAARRADAAAPAGVYPTANDIRTQKILEDAPAGNHSSRAPETRQMPGDSANSSGPVPFDPVSSPASSAEPLGKPGLPDVSFDLDRIESIKRKEFAERNTHWHEIVTKLDLARAYQEMGDKEAARQVLQEVSREGDVQQQESARLMLAVL